MLRVFADSSTDVVLRAEPCSGRTGRHGCGVAAVDGSRRPTGTPDSTIVRRGHVAAPGVVPARSVLLDRSHSGVSGPGAAPGQRAPGAAGLTVPSGTSRTTAASATGARAGRPGRGRPAAPPGAGREPGARRGAPRGGRARRAGRAGRTQELAGGPLASQPVEAGVDDDAVQPRRDGRLAAEGGRAPEGGDEARPARSRRRARARRSVRRATAHIRSRCRRKSSAKASASPSTCGCQQLPVVEVGTERPPISRRASTGPFTDRAR